MNLGSIFGRSAAKEAAAKAAAEAAAKKAEQAAIHDAGVSALMKEITVTPESSVKAIFDSFERSKGLVYSNGANYVGTFQGDAVKALLDKQIYAERRWEIYPETEYRKLQGSFSSESAQTLFKTRSATSGAFSFEEAHTLIAPLAPSQVANELYFRHGLILHDMTSHQRLPIASNDELMKAARVLLKH